MLSSINMWMYEEIIKTMIVVKFQMCQSTYKNNFVQTLKQSFKCIESIVVSK